MNCTDTYGCKYYNTLSDAQLTCTYPPTSDSYKMSGLTIGAIVLSTFVCIILILCCIYVERSIYCKLGEPEPEPVVAVAV